ncbi:MAG: hypothetical protein ACTSUE_08090 [Promethearchaeota archaeon]
MGGQQSICAVGDFTSPPVTYQVPYAESQTSTFPLNDYRGECKDFADPSQNSFTNTNFCVAESLNLRECENGLTEACCASTQTFVNLGCRHNPAMEYLTISQSPNGQAEWDAFPILVTACENQVGETFADFGAAWWTRYQRGCQISDMELEKQRLESAFGFSAPFQAAGDTETPYDVDQLQADLGLHVTPNISVFVPYGIGLYEGVENMAEYVGILFAANNRGLWIQDEQDPTAGGTLEFSINSHELSLAGKSSGTFANGTYVYTDEILSQTYKFEGCETKISAMEVHASETFARFSSAFYILQKEYDEYGKENICRFHEEYCTGPNQQYADFDDCITYMNSVPDYSPACEDAQLILSGNSVTCRFKHAFMIPVAPEKHCPHIGRDGDPNRNNVEHKCEDAYECLFEEPDPSWPPLQIPETGVPLSQEWQDSIEEQNEYTAPRLAGDEPWIFPNLA